MSTLLLPMLERRDFLLALLASGTRLLRERGWPVLRAGDRQLTAPGEGASIEVTLSGERYPRPGDPITEDTAGVQYRCAPATLHDQTAAAPGLPGCFRRVLRVRNTSGRTLDLTGAMFRLRLCVPEDAARWKAQSFAMAETSGGGPVVSAAFTSSEDRWEASVTRAPEGLLVQHTCHAAWRLDPGAEAVIGVQYFWAVKGDLAAARSTTAAWYRAVGLQIPAALPDWIRDAVLLEASAGGTLDGRFGDTGGFDAFASQADYFADAGFNALWLLNPLTHKNPRQPREGWNPYDPLSYDEVDPEYGGEAALSRLIARLRARGFKLLCEMVPHGGRSTVAQNPAFWTYNRDGSRKTGFGQAPDYSAPGWQAEIRKTVRYLTRQFKVDGWRVDVADGYGINWNANRPHVSRSTMAGAIGMLGAIREGARDEGVNAVLLPETLGARPEFAPAAGLGYGFALKFFLEYEAYQTLTPAERVSKLRKHFEEEQHSLPPGFVHLRGPDNHDTTGFFGHGEHRYGIGLHRALVAVCFLVDGFPMLYQNEERGSYEHLRRLAAARAACAELRRGACDYGAVSGPENVFAVLRAYQGRHAIGLVNFSHKRVEGRFTVRADAFPDGARLSDAIAGGGVRIERGRFAFTLPPYACAVLRADSGPAPLPAERHTPQSISKTPARAPLSIETKADRVLIRAYGLEALLGAEDARIETEKSGGKLRVRAEGGRRGRITLSIRGADRWYVQSRTGLYADRLVRRHFPWPGEYRWDPAHIAGHDPHRMYRGTLRVDRLWQAASSPLVPGGIIALAGASGGGLKLGDIGASGDNIVFSDSSMSAEPEYYCAVEWFAADPHLNPHWAPKYLGRLWRVIPPYPRADDERFRVSFTLEAAGQIRFEDLDGYELPEFARARMEVAPGSWTRIGQNALLLREPNTVAWSRLPLETAGEYTLFLLLRHSQKARDGTDMTGAYQIVFDGQPMKWSWQRLNAAPVRAPGVYMGWARVPLGRLAASEHELRIATSGPGGVIGEELFVSRDPAFTL